MEIQAVIENAMQRLEVGHREVLILHDVEGLTAIEVGKVLGITVEAVKSRLHRACSLMREFAAPALGIPLKQEAISIKSLCPDVVMMFSSHLKATSIPAPALPWNDTFRIVNAAGTPAIRSRRRCPYAGPDQGSTFLQRYRNLSGKRSVHSSPYKPETQFCPFMEKYDALW